MKAVLYCAILLISAPAFAQQVVADKPSAAKTKLEAFTGNTGSVTIKGYTNIGTTSGQGSVAVTAITLRNPNSDKITSGLSFDVEEQTASSLEKSRRAFVDADELQALVDGIRYIGKVTTSATSLANFEASYTTRGEFQITSFNNSAGKTGIAVRAGGNYVGAQAYLDLDDLNNLVSTIEKGRKILETAK